ncbi:hypothetical protein [Methanosarcina barkeri]|uniref:hypothetical protein n=1 Tax=Methanosarcina barkeri TaxID=2208 RepID=UPI000B2B7837|nr:hypothetical protein [Methanosarcina barkeri]
MANDFKENRSVRTGKPGRTNKTGKTSKRTSRTDKTTETAYDRLDKALAAHEKALEKNPEDAAAWAGKAAVFLKHRRYSASLKAIKKKLLKSSLKTLTTFTKKVLCSCSSTGKEMHYRSLTGCSK